MHISPDAMHFQNCFILVTICKWPHQTVPGNEASNTRHCYVVRFYLTLALQMMDQALDHRTIKVEHHAGSSGEGCNGSCGVVPRVVVKVTWQNVSMPELANKHQGLA